MHHSAFIRPWGRARGGERTAQTNIVVVVQLVDGLNLASNVQVLDRLVQVDDGGVLGITTKDKLALLLPKIQGKSVYVSGRSTL